MRIVSALNEPAAHNAERPRTASVLRHPKPIPLEDILSKTQRSKCIKRPFPCRLFTGLFHAETLTHQVSRPVNCKTRGEFCEFWSRMIPVVEFGRVVPGMLKTLKKSMLKRRDSASVRRIALKADAFIVQTMGPEMNCCCIGCRLVL